MEFSVGGESFHCTGMHVTIKGFTTIMPWLAVNDKNIPSFAIGQKIGVSKLELYEVTWIFLTRIQCTNSETLIIDWISFVLPCPFSPY